MWTQFIYPEMRIVTRKGLSTSTGLSRTLLSEHGDFTYDGRRTLVPRSDLAPTRAEGVPSGSLLISCSRFVPGGYGDVARSQLQTSNLDLEKVSLRTFYPLFHHKTDNRSTQPPLPIHTYPSSSSIMGADLFDIAVCTIFAREFMEGAVIIGEYRTVIQRSELTEDGPTKERMLREVSLSAAFAAFLAVLVVAIVAIPLAVLSKDFDDKTGTIIEGISKVVAAVCILQLSLKMPKWLGFYKSKKNGKIIEGCDLSIRSIRFNVAWNVWREVAECGVFLLPFLLQGENVAAIPLSMVAGSIIGLLAGFGIYYANRTLENKLLLAVFTTLLLVFLATGLFVGGCHEFEEVWGETENVWRIEGRFWDHHDLPMAILKPFGYSSSRSVLQITTFWCWLALSAGLHYYKIRQTARINDELALLGDKTETAVEEADVEKGSTPAGSDVEEEQLSAEEN
jgi:high-affinity iron transporter